jgi:excinuclease ABC subunit C
MPARLARKTMSLTHRLFGMRSCNEVITGERDRPCLEYDIKRCIAPCVVSICSPEEYGRAVRLTKLFLESRNEELLGTLRSRMQEAAEQERFEEAAQLRDAIRTIQTLHDRQQKMATTELGHRDVFGARIGPAGAVVIVFQVRRGKVVERIELESSEGIAGTLGEVLEAAVQQFYELRAAPPEIHLPTEPDDKDALEAWLTSRADRKVRVVVPQRGEKRGLIDLATRNAAIGYESRFNQTTAAQYDALHTLQSILALPAFLHRIECFDVSTIQGSETVASMVVCEDGRMRRSEYRKYRIRPMNDQHNNDFAAMQQVVTRRCRKLLEEGGPFPDLIVIDGGKGQLSAAYAALEQLGLSNLVAVGLAKKEELIFARDRLDPIALPASDPALLLLQRIRDEAHRFAVTFHRSSRTRRDLRSDLDRVPGIGPRRRQTLLTRFGSLAGVRRASREELVSAVGAKTADAVLAFFQTRP